MKKMKFSYKLTLDYTKTTNSDKYKNIFYVNKYAEVV